MPQAARTAQAASPGVQGRAARRAFRQETLAQARTPVVTVKAPLCQAPAKGHCAGGGVPEQAAQQSPSGCYKAPPL